MSTADADQTLERDKAVMPTYAYNRKMLDKHLIDAYVQTWVKTGLITPT